MRFLLLDRIDRLESGRRIEARKAVSFEETWLPRPTPPYPALPHALLLEAVLQAGMWLLREASGFTRQPLVIAAEEVELAARPVVSGDCLRLVAEVRQHGPDGAVLRGEAWVGEERVARGERIVCTWLPLEQFIDPAEARGLFDEMVKPKHARMERPA